LYRKIKLTRGKVALVDLEDYERLAQFTWLVWQDWITGRFYAGRWSRKEEQAGRLGKSMIPMHQEVLGKIEGFRIDHIRPNDTLDNRKTNLRYATASQNGANRPAPSHNSSGFKGVCFSRREQKWRAYLTLNRKQIHLGFFKDKNQAARAYDMAALKAFGDFAHLNIPSSTVDPAPLIKPGCCHCGCGGKTGLASRNRPSSGYVKGRPYKFLSGHRPAYSSLEEKISVAKRRAS
jgi:hypothetical protein